jgi:hypothetical protein
MLDEIEEDYYEEEDRCRGCRGRAEAESETVPCQFCRVEFATGRLRYRCTRCKNEWLIGTRGPLSSHRNAVCSHCRLNGIGSCAICEKAVTGSEARNTDGAVVCNKCLAAPESIWCPACSLSFPYHGYLKGVFHDDRPGLHAAALVTHYRHTHVRSHDRAWQSPRYAAKIPNYDYDENKAKTNNQAKRELIRAVATHVRNGSYPESAPIGARELVCAFGRLQELDEETIALIHATLEKFDQPGNSPGS